MTKQKVQTSTHIENTPEAVMSYIAEVRNRPLYLPSLKSIEDIKGAGAGTTWKWTWVIFGVEFQGVGRCLDYQPGKLYSFRTEGGIESTWTYRAVADAKGTQLTIELEYTVPERVLPRLRADPHKAEVEQVVQNLKTILDK
jgi:Polyketide cyclase / dehydrase and lipid transport